MSLATYGLRDVEAKSDTIEAGAQMIDSRVDAVEQRLSTSEKTISDAFDSALKQLQMQQATAKPSHCRTNQQKSQPDFCPNQTTTRRIKLPLWRICCHENKTKTYQFAQLGR